VQAIHHPYTPANQASGATGTGKTVTLQRLVEQASRIAVPTLLADVKGDLFGLAAAGQEKALFSQRRELLGLEPAAFVAYPVEFWDVLGDQGLLLLDLKDLQELLRHLGENARAYQTTYGNISAASVGAIQRGLLALEQQSADRFFGEPRGGRCGEAEAAGDLR